MEMFIHALVPDKRNTLERVCLYCNLSKVEGESHFLLEIDTRYKIFYFPIMEPSTEQNNHLQIKEHKIHI